MNWKLWLKGLISSAIGAGAGAVPAVITDPKTFNIHEGLPNLGAVMVVSAVLALANYLAKSPLPEGSK